MKKLITITAIILTLFTAPAFAAASVARVSVNGLVCDFCARALEKVFGKEEAVSGIDVDLSNKIITINFKDGQDIADGKIADLITDSGYNVEGISRDE